MGTFILTMVTLVFCLFGRKLAGTIITAPMIFIALGFGFATAGGLGDLDVSHTLHTVAEIALVLLLFLDAGKTDFASLKHWRRWPTRMLLIGLPLSVIIGTLLIAPLVPGWPLAAAALAAAILSPTDAALGQAVIANPEVPDRPRQSLTVESGLNDGLALPIILMLASLAAGIETQESGYWLRFATAQLVLGPLVGVSLGLLGGWALVWAMRHETSAPAFEGIATISLAAGCYVLADLVGGNGFIAAFTGGLAFGQVTKGRSEFLFEFTEGEGQMLAWAAFFLIGLGLMPEAIAYLNWGMLAVILTSLFVVRPLAIWLSLIGTDADARTRLFFGWFGPRGLATALFALLVIPEIDEMQAVPILDLAVNAVWISALLHGLTAAPGARWYGRKSRGGGRGA